MNATAPTTRPRADALDESDALLLRLLAPDAPAPEAPPDVDWAALVERARPHLLLPLLHERLLPILGALPPEVAQRLGAARRAAVVRTMIHAQALAALVAAFEAEGIPLIAYKGAPMARQLYGDPTVRLSGDIDLIVRQADWERACALFRALGWAEEYDWMNHRDFVLTAGEIETRVELHWSNQRKGEYFLPDEILWAESEPSEEGRLFTPEMSLLSMVLHAERHSFEALRLMVDLAHAVARWHGTLDWEKLAALADRAGALPLVATTLLVLARDFGAPLPPAGRLRAAMAGRRVRLGARLLSTERLFAERRYPAFFRHGLALLVGAYKHPAIFLADFLRSPEEIAFKYSLPRGSKRVYLYYLFRPFDITWSYVRRLFER